VQSKLQTPYKVTPPLINVFPVRAVQAPDTLQGYASSY
jgi:hypothetical protein